MRILGIETSCDETAAAVVVKGQKVLSNVVVSSLAEHKKYGGIIPEIASRRQLTCIKPVIDTALNEAGLRQDQIDAVAVTVTPGLIGSLLVGTSFARAFSWAADKPLIEVDHIKAHVYASFLDAPKNQPKPAKHRPRPELPAVGLVVSGGHTSLYHIRSFQNYQLMGQTRDDAIGEAYDKVGRILNLDYPGGPIIDRLAQKGKKSEIQFTCARLPDTLDFSFSGIKTAVLYYVRQQKNITPTQLNDIAYTFQHSVVDVLVQKSVSACRKTKSKTLVVGGGVAANQTLRQRLTAEAAEQGINVYFPAMAYCLDNAAMIAGYAYHIHQ